MVVGITDWFRTYRLLKLVIQISNEIYLKSNFETPVDLRNMSGVRNGEVLLLVQFKKCELQKSNIKQKGNILER